MSAVQATVQRAATRDLDSILTLWSAMMEEHQRQDSRIRLAPGALPAYRAYVHYHQTNADSLVQVAIAEHTVVGFCLLTVSRNLPMFLPARYGYLSDLVVSPAWRRRGIGRELVRQGSQWLRERGVDTIQLQYYNFNEEGGAFWREMGFRPFYTRMWLDLT